MPGTCLSDGRPSLRQTRPMGLPALATEILLYSALFVNDRCFPEDQWRVRRKFRLYTESYKSQCSPASHHLCFPAFVFILMVESLLHTELHSWHLCCGSAVLSLSDSATLWAAAQGIFCVTPVGCHFLLQGISPRGVKPAFPVSPALQANLYCWAAREAQWLLYALPIFLPLLLETRLCYRVHSLRWHWVFFIVVSHHELKFCNCLTPSDVGGKVNK